MTKRALSPSGADWSPPADESDHNGVNTMQVIIPNLLIAAAFIVTVAIAYGEML